jgi:hypothetical protein
MPVALAPLFIVLIVLPTIVYYLALTTSLAFGSCLAAIILIARFMEPLVRREITHVPAPGGAASVGGAAVRAAMSFRAATPLVLAVLLLALIAAHAAVAWSYQPFDGARAAGSGLMLVLIVLGGCALGDALLAAQDTSVERSIRVCFVLFCLVAAGGIAGISPQTSMTSAKALFPFTEPSHFALIFTPFYVFSCARAQGAKRLLVLFTGVAIAGLLQNLTLLSVCALAALLCLRGIVLIPLLVMFALALGSLELVDLSYYTSRLDLSSDTQNLSAIVYLQGWQLIGESWQRSGGWGVGFQQLGMHGTEVPAAEMIYGLTQNEGNLRDGGFGLAKLAGEFGLFGVLIVLAFVRYAWRAARELRRAAHTGRICAARLFALSAIVGYSIEIFVRGTGYFSSTSILLVAAFWFLAHEPRPDRQ